MQKTASDMRISDGSSDLCSSDLLDGGAGVLHLDVGEGVRAAFLADEQRVALGVVARAVGGSRHLDQAAVGVLAAAGADALADDLALGALADVDHLGAGVGLLAVVGERDRVELAGDRKSTRLNSSQ